MLAVVYPMQELFSGNQNIYFLWGTAELLPNAFAADPLLQSPDPYPLFSWIISVFPLQFLGIWTTLLYILLNSVYSFSLFGIADRIAPIYSNRIQLFSFSALFLFLHSSPIWGTYFQLLFDIDLRWMWDSGIAEQGVLRGYLQPSVFGVFLILSLYQVMKRNYTLAIFCMAPAAAIHASYLFLGGLLTILILLQANFGKKNVLAAGTVLLLILPYSYYIFSYFMELQEGVKTAINHAVMAGFEDNIHINPSNWLNPKFYLQIPIILLGIAFLWKTQLRNLILGAATIGMLLTALAYGMHNTTLISLNPWRISILIMPIATIAILAKGLSNGVWFILRPHILSMIGIASIALIVYRLFGSSSADFLNTWKLVQLGLFVVAVASAAFIFKIEILNKLLSPTLILVLVSVGLTDTFVDGISKSSKEEFKAISAIEQKTEPNTIYIIPPHWTSFRMNAQKAVFADENLVYGPALPSLMKRLEVIETAYKTNDFSDVLSSLPVATTIKVIALSEIEIPTAVAKEAMTDRYSCFTLRQ